MQTTSKLSKEHHMTLSTTQPGTSSMPKLQTITKNFDNSKREESPDSFTNNHTESNGRSHHKKSTSELAKIIQDRGSNPNPSTYMSKLNSKTSTGNFYMNNPNHTSGLMKQPSRNVFKQAKHDLKSGNTTNFGFGSNDTSEIDEIQQEAHKKKFNGNSTTIGFGVNKQGSYYQNQRTSNNKLTIKERSKYQYESQNTTMINTMNITPNNEIARSPSKATVNIHMVNDYHTDDLDMNPKNLLNTYTQHSMAGKAKNYGLMNSSSSTMFLNTGDNRNSALNCANSYSNGNNIGNMINYKGEDGNCSKVVTKVKSKILCDKLMHEQSNTGKSFTNIPFMGQTIPRHIRTRSHNLAEGSNFRKPGCRKNWMDNDISIAKP